MPEECMYCAENYKLRGLMSPIIKMRSSKLYLLRDQSFPGRCVLALNTHKREVFELDDKEMADFFSDLKDAAETVHRLFNPAKINYAVFGDIVSHFHFHIVPKYEGELHWGIPYCEGPAEMIFLPEEKFNERIKHIADDLRKQKRLLVLEE